MPAVKLSVGNENRKKIAVISHERSGTHFLMNTLALNFGFISNPWWNFDFEIGLNFHSSEALHSYFRQAENIPVLNILKSHHQIDFFIDFIDYFLEQFNVFYIYRDPRDALVSNWKLINKLPWNEGPKTKTAMEFIKSEPSGGMLRYQKKQEPTMMHRWETHVTGWLDFANSKAGEKLIVISYEDLNLRFQDSLNKIARRLDLKNNDFVIPAKNYNVVGTGQGFVNGHKNYLNESDNECFFTSIENTIKRLGYEQFNSLSGRP